MPVAISLRAALLSLLTAGALTACGGDSADDEPAADPEVEAEGAPAPADAPSSGAPAADAANAPLEPADIDRWQQGMTAELGAVREASAKLASAKNNEDTLNAMMGVQEMSTAEAGARAAGVDLERYKVIRSNLSAATGYLTPHIGGIDTTMLSPAQREEMRQQNAAQLQNLESQVPADVVEALRPRAEALRKQELELVAARLKGAGM